ncbi:hypothetical protein [Wolbachia endosymbiont of Wuchereria bancrofti]|nr:hypothetical protein [Wolbachia endosymbiont of Wuchereria bancrofti]
MGTIIGISKKALIKFFPKLVGLALLFNDVGIAIAKQNFSLNAS